MRLFRYLGAKISDSGCFSFKRAGSRHAGGTWNVEKFRDWSEILAHIESSLPIERTTLPALGGQLEECKPRISSQP
jgi:hypothetical protein